MIRDRRTLASIALLGAASAAFQTLFARELYAAFSGREAILCGFLAPWLLLTALGAALGRRGGSERASSLALFTLGPSSVLALVIARVLPRWFEAGTPPGLAAAVALTTVLLAPACVCSGLSFTWLAQRPGAGSAYLAESAGSAVAGAALSVVVLGRAGDFTIAAAILVLAGLAASLATTGRAARAMAATSAATALLVAVLPVGSWALALQGPTLAFAEERASVHASVVTARAASQTTVYVNRTPVASSSEDAAAEEAAHLPLALHPAPRTVAVIGVAPVGIMTQIARHGVERIDLILDDDTLLEVLRREFPDLRHPLVHAAVADARGWLARHPSAYDVVLLPSAEPTTLAQNRMLTAELFGVLRAALRPGGVVAVSLPEQAQRASVESRRLCSSVRRTVDAGFGASIVLPAGRTLVLAGNGAALPERASVVAEVARTLFTQRGIRGVHLTEALLHDRLSASRMADADRWSSLGEAVNRDLHPTTVRLALDRMVAELDEMGSGALGILAVMILAGVLLVLDPRSRPVELAVWSGGTGALVTQVVLMFGYQIAAGALYREVGLLLSGFMLGAAFGAALGARVPATQRAVLGFDLVQLALSLLLALVLPVVVEGAGAGAGARVAAFGLTVLAGLAPGAQLAAAARLTGDLGAVYAADLAGAAMAALVAAPVVVPALGLRGALLAVGGLKAMTSLALLAGAQRDTRSRPATLAPALPLAMVGFTILAAGGRSTTPVYAFTFSRPYQWAAFAVLMLALLAVFEPARLRAWTRATAKRAASFGVLAGLSPGRLLAFVVLLPVAMFPVARCYFRVPFVFCHVCPRQCVFGVMRPYVVPSALLANLGDQTFCERVCPLGTAQASCERLRPARASRRRVLTLVANGLRVVALGFVAVSYLFAQDGRGPGVDGGGYYGAFFKNAFTPTPTVLAVAAALLVASFFVQRPFCEGLCPIGATSQLVRQLDRRKRPEPHA